MLMQEARAKVTACIASSVLNRGSYCLTWLQADGKSPPPQASLSTPGEMAGVRDCNFIVGTIPT